MFTKQRNRGGLLPWAASALVILAMWASAEADLIVYETPPGADIDGQPVSARATLTTGPDQITVLLENLEADPKSVAQNLSGFLFTVSTGQAAGALTGSTGTPRHVAADGTYADGPADSTGWQLRTTDAQLDLYVLGVPGVGPAHTILGPPADSGKYEKAKGSISGNAPHNPFLGEIATFELDVPGVTAASGITQVTFCFNTGPGDTITVPEPAALVVLALGALASLMRRRRA